MRNTLFVLMLVMGLGGTSTAGQLLELDGDIIQGGLVIGRTEADSKVVHDGLRTRVTPEGYFLLGFNRDGSAKSTLIITFPDGSTATRQLKVAQRTYNIQRIEGLPKRKVNPKPVDGKRIKADGAAVRKARVTDDSRTDFLSGFEWPVTGRISGVYGSQRVLNGKPKRPHYGVDIARKTGTPVAAPADATVTLVHPDMFFSGATLIMDHGYGLSSTFIHLDEILVAEGQQVKKGDIVAKIGSSGRATGPHLDWRINLFKKRLDPQLLVEPMPQQGDTN